MNNNIREKYEMVEIFGSCMNITKNLRTELILVPIESPEFALSIGTKIDSVRKLSTVLAQGSKCLQNNVKPEKLHS